MPSISLDVQAKYVSQEDRPQHHSGGPIETREKKKGSSGNRVGSWKDVGGSQGSPLLCKEGRGEVESLPAYTNQGPPTRPSLWMPLPLLASPYKGEESEGRPHKSLKSQNKMWSPRGGCERSMGEGRSEDDATDRRQLSSPRVHFEVGVLFESLNRDQYTSRTKL